MEGKSSNQYAETERFFTLLPLIMSDISESVQCSDHEFFYHKIIAIFLYDSNSKISQNLLNLVLFEKKT